MWSGCGSRARRRVRSILASCRERGFEGKAVGESVAACVKGRCAGERKYEVLHGTTTRDEYNAANGWEVTSFQTNGF